MDPDGVAKVLAAAAEKQQARDANIEASRAADGRRRAALPRWPGISAISARRHRGALRRPRVLFGDDPGLGKTIQAIGMINADASIKRVLVVSRDPQAELAQRVAQMAGAGSQNCDSLLDVLRPDAFDITIINYDILTKHQNTLRSVAWDLIVCDEAHLLKNPKAKRTRAICGIDDYTSRKEGFPVLEPINARRAAFLTGTQIC